MRIFHAARLLPLPVLLTLTTGIGIADAAEGSPAYPIGSTGEFVAAFPPLEGFFYQNTVAYTYSNELVGNDGKKVPGSDYHLKVTTDTHRFIASWGEYGGFRVYSQFLVPVIYGDTSLKFNGATVTSGNSFGVGNLAISPLALIHEFDKENNIVISYDYFSDIGNYSTKNAFNPALGYAFHSPVLAFGHSLQEGFYYAALARGVFTEKNTDTDYQTGDAVAFEYKAGWRAEKYSISLVGGYYDQYQRDRGANVAADGNKARQLTIGPSFTYNFGPLIFNANFQTTPYARNAAKTNTLYVSLSVPLYVPPSARGAMPTDAP